MTYEKFEYKVISMLLNDKDPNYERLFKQYLSAEASKHEETENGFIVIFKVPKHLAVDEITRQISGVRVMLTNEEVLSLELIVLEGIITQLNAIYTSKIKSLNVILQSDDLNFTANNPNVSSEVKIELSQFSILVEKASQLLTENIQINEQLAENEKRKSELVEKFEQLFSESNRTKNLLKQEQDQSIELTDKIAELLAERIQINELLIQGQVENAKLVEKVNQFKKGLEYFDLEPEQEFKYSLEPSLALGYDPEPDPEFDPKPDPEPDPEFDPESDPEPDPEFDPEPDPVLSFDPGFEPDPVLSFDPEFEPDPAPPLDPDSDPDPEPDSDSESEPELELQPESKLESDPALDPDSEPEPESEPTLESDPKPEPKFESVPKSELTSTLEPSILRVESQREKLSPPSERITDNFINKIFGKKANANKYRRNTKYHIAVWKLAFTMVINVLLYLLITGAFAIMLLLFAQNLLAESNVMGFSALRVVSASMEPEIPVNSLIVIRQDNPNNLEIGQIATYLRGDGLLITHRILYIEQDNSGNKIGFILKGDANITPSEEVVPGENILGRVVFASHIIGQLLLFFETRFMLIIAITIFLLIILYVIKRKKKRAMSH